jgi:hypothetical protein
MIRKLLLAAGIISSLLYVAMNLFIPRQYPGYSAVTYTVSELSAIGAPTRPLWTAWALVYTIFVTAFGWGIVKSAGTNRAIKVMGVLILIYGALGVGWHFAPMHQREALAAGGGNLSDTIHIAITFVTVSLMVAAMSFGAASFGKTFRYYSIISLVMLMIFGILTALEAPGIDSNKATPLIGVWERLNIGIFLLWVVAVTVVLLRRLPAKT